MEFRQQSDEPTPRPEAAPLAVPEQREAPRAPMGGPPFAPASAPPIRGRRRWGRLKLVLAVLAGVLALLCLGGVGVGFVLYDQATRVDRNSPDVVVSSYLRGLFVQRDDAAAALYACDDQSALADIRSLRADIDAREREHNIKIRVEWGSLLVQEDGERASVTTDISRTITDGSESDRQTWRFDVVDSDGWRVCGARRQP